MLALGMVLVVGFAVTPPAVEARTTSYRVGGRITLDTNLLSRSGLSAWAIDEYLASNTPLSNLGHTFLAAERKYGINARFLIAAALHESGWGSSYIARSKHNLFGYNAYDRCASACATRFRNQAAGIDKVAAFMKSTYLVRSGRWWGGAPTLRSMQRFWSSSGTWGKNVAHIANSLHFGSLAGRGIAFAEPSALGTFHGASAASFELGWKGALPGGVTFVATWTSVLLDRDVDLVIPPVDPAVTLASTPAATDADAVTDSPAVEPSSAPPTVAVAAPKPLLTNAIEKATRGGTRLTVRTPAEPGVYRVAFEMRDRDGSLLPVRDRVSIPVIEARVWGAHGIKYSVERSADGSNVVATVTNMGSAAIPAFPDAVPVVEGAGVVANDWTPRPVTRFIVHALTSRLDPTGRILASVPLTEDLVPGTSVSAFIPGPLAKTSTAFYLVVEVRLLDDPSHPGTPRAQGFWLPVSVPVTQPGNAPQG
jgi:hypothetical protein